MSQRPIDEHDDVASLEAGLDALDTPTQAPRAAAGSASAARCSRRSCAVLFFALVWAVVVALKVKPTYVIPPRECGTRSSPTGSREPCRRRCGTRCAARPSGFAVSVVVGTRARAAARAVPLRAHGDRPARLRACSRCRRWPGCRRPSSGSASPTPRSTWSSCSAPCRRSPTVCSPASTRCRRCTCASGACSAPAAGPRSATSCCPAAMPGYLAGLRQGWAFAWRSLMAAELITFSPALGTSLGQLLQTGRELSDMSLVVRGDPDDPRRRRRHRAAGLLARSNAACCARAA